MNVNEAIDWASRAPIEELCASSFRNFHARGLDYLCLHRSQFVTCKAYFFDGDTDKLPEVVIPHDHRYNFVSTVLAGCVSERLFAYLDTEVSGYEPYEEFAWDTPLNGGDGFTWRQTSWLKLLEENVYEPGESYETPHQAIHTLNIRAPQSVLFLVQYHDRVPMNVPTASFRPANEREPINVSGLYDVMTPDHARTLLSRLTELAA